jgi:hypothetical protein
MTALGAGIKGAPQALGGSLIKQNTAFDLGRPRPITGRTTMDPPTKEEKALRGLGACAGDPAWDETLLDLARALHNGPVRDVFKQTPITFKAIKIAKRPLLGGRLGFLNREW